MHIRSLQPADHSAVAKLLVATFRPFFEGYARPLLGEPVFVHQHGRWEEDYVDDLPTLHQPHAGRHAAVAHQDDGTITGLVSWRFDQKPAHGEIYLLAVSPDHRRQHTGRRLCEHALAHLRGGGADVVQVATGGDPFHAPARALYEDLGLTPVPVCVYLGAI